VSRYITRCRVDSNHAQIVRALRQLGVMVQSLAEVGNGVPDLLCGISGIFFAVEIKDGKRPASERKLTAEQERWHAAAASKRLPVFIVASVDDVADVVRIVSAARRAA